MESRTRRTRSICIVKLLKQKKTVVDDSFLFCFLPYIKKNPMEENVIILTDKIADSYIKSPTKNTLHFHHVLNVDELFEVTIYNNIEIIPQMAAFNYIFIKDSEKHHILLDAIREQLLPITNDSKFFPHLTMKILNDCITNLHNREKSVNAIREKIGPNYTIPEKFEAVMYDLPQYCITIIHPGVLRCVTTITNPNIIRLSCIYRIRERKWKDDLPNFGRPKQARNYEVSKTIYKKQIWPYQLHPINSLKIEFIKNPNIVCFALSKDANYSIQWTNYLYTLMFDLNNLSNELVNIYLWNSYRNPNQLQSKHIPSYHGRTCYGHYFPLNLELFQKIEPIVTNMCPQGFVTTCDFAIQYIPRASCHKRKTTANELDKKKQT